MHLQQTKAKSRKSGGPQYYFHNLTEDVREFLRRKGARSVVLQTPYGVVETPFVAVGKDHKLESGSVVAGKVGHDRIQQGAQATESIGEAIRRWYRLNDADFERIDIDVDGLQDGHFVIWPAKVTWRGKMRSQVLTRPSAHPLSFHNDDQSRLWREQISFSLNQSEEQARWIREQICRVVEDHRRVGEKNVHEFDVLRVTGALSKLGVNLGPLRVRGYDCSPSAFRFEGYENYPCPVELKKRSSGFNYQEARYLKLPRVVILCVEHDRANLPAYADAVDLSALCEYLSKAA